MQRPLVIHSLCAAALLIPSMGRGAMVNPNPKVGYLLPPGGQRGNTVEVTITGSQISQPTGIVVEGDRIEAHIEHTYRAMRAPLERDERRVVHQALAMAREGRAISESLVSQIPDRPYLRPLRNPDVRPTEHDLRRIEYEYFLFEQQRLRRTARLGRDIRARFRIPRNVEPGPYEVRLLTRFGTSNPVHFIVGDCPETLEAEPCTADEQPVDPPLDLPICINGQIYPGDVDIYRFRAREGQTVSLHAAARELKPFLADGVPGWFEAMLALYGGDGKEITYRDCTQFRPDPTIVFTVPRDGVYTVHLRDSLYRGRWDFVYRLTIREHVPAPMREFTHTLAQPEAVNTHRFDARKGRDLCIRTEARVHGSPIDTFVQVVDENGKVLAENDDAPTSLNIGLQTAFTDSFLRFTPPADGTYYVRVADTAQMGGPEYGYELSIAPPAPGFDCYATPAALDLSSGRGVHLTFNAVRHDGFDGEISIRLSGASRGYRLDGATIPAGQNSVAAVLFAPAQLSRGPRTSLQFVATSRCGGKYLSATVIPANEWQQAFIRRHLVPTDSFQVAFPRQLRRLSAQFRLVQRSPLRLVPDRPTVVQMQMTSRPSSSKLAFRLLHGPKGVSLTSSKLRNGELELTFSSEKPVTERGNLIVEALINVTAGRRGAGKREGEFPAGVLPAMPYGP